MPLLMASTSTSGKPSKRERERVDRRLRHLARARRRSGPPGSSGRRCPPRRSAPAGACLVWPWPQIFSSQSGCVAGDGRERVDQVVVALLRRVAARGEDPLGAQVGRGGSISRTVFGSRHIGGARAVHRPLVGGAVLVGEHGQRVERRGSGGPSPCAGSSRASARFICSSPTVIRPGTARSASRMMWPGRLAIAIPRAPAQAPHELDVGPQVVVVAAEVGRVVERAREPAQQRCAAAAGGAARALALVVERDDLHPRVEGEVGLARCAGRSR